MIRQVVELHRIEPIVDGYRLHRLTCRGCGATTCGDLPPGVSSGGFGSYLRTALALLAGAYRLSKRQIQQAAFDLFGLSISTRMIAKLERQSAADLDAPYHELALSVHQSPVVHIDETSWREQLRKAWLWGTVTPLATVFTIAKNRSGEVARALLGSQDGQLVASDRCSAYEWVRGVEPTNNAVERALRHAVIWRRISGGTASVQGSRFVERMLTAAATSRQQGRHVLAYLASRFEAARRGHAVPSLLPAHTSDVNVA